jgi:hypothetical protein
VQSRENLPNGSGELAKSEVKTSQPFLITRSHIKEGMLKALQETRKWCQQESPTLKGARYIAQRSTVHWDVQKSDSLDNSSSPDSFSSIVGSDG